MQRQESGLPPALFTCCAAKVDFLKADIEGAGRHALIGNILRSGPDYRMMFESSGRCVYCG